MRTLGTSTLLALALCVAVGAGIAHAQTGKLDGTWVAVSAERDGKPAADLKGHVLVLSEQQFMIRREYEPIYVGTFVTDPDQKPAQIDFHHSDGQAKGQTWLGIYRLEGSTLTIVDNAPDPTKPRPRRFATAPDSGLVRLTFKRSAQ